MSIRRLVRRFQQFQTGTRSPCSVIRTGLDDIDYPVSRIYALAVFPETGAFPGANRLATGD